jgi:hypothetical protein
MEQDTKDVPVVKKYICMRFCTKCGEFVGLGTEEPCILIVIGNDYGRVPEYCPYDASMTPNWREE